jgi:hypothetical protein
MSRTLLGDVTPIVMITDPRTALSTMRRGAKTPALESSVRPGVVHNDDRIDWTDAYRLFAGNVAYVWHAGVHTKTVAANLEAAGLRIRSQIIWRNSTSR